jgi:alkaline phosphatase D
MTRLIFVLSAMLAACFPPRQPQPPSSVPPNSASAQAAPYVVLVSFDGFRHDYAARHGAPTLDRFAREGASAPEGMMPVFPSLTFPNHYSLATGLYPARHGIVANTFRSPEKDKLYQISKRNEVEDGSWYGGTPLWNLAERQGMRSACYFWVGSEADVEGMRPTYYYRYDGKVPNGQRVEQVLAWLRLPEAQRPHFITLYFSIVDSKGHEHGPDAPETRAAVREVDSLLGVLDQGIAQTGLPVNLVVVSDHGMLAIDREHPIQLDESAYEGMEIARSGSICLFYSDDSAVVERSYRRLKATGGPFDVYRSQETPAHLHYRGHPNIGQLVLVARPPYYVGSGLLPISPGAHGYDPSVCPEMKAIFYAKGPAFLEGKALPPFESVHVYPLIARILGLELPPGLDGRTEMLMPALR